MNRRAVLTFFLLASLTALRIAAAFDWQSLVPPSGSPPSSGDSATGTAATRGIGEDQGVASRGRGDGGVGAIEGDEPDEAHVRKFAEKGDLALGRAPEAEPVAAARGNASADLGSLVQTFDPTGYGGAAVKGMKGITGFGAAEEHELGRRVAVEVLAQYGLYRNRDAEEYANLVAAVVGRSSDRPELHYHVGLLDTDKVNAFSAPGGYLFVTRGALGLIRDEAELAGVLGHEIAHVTDRHVLRELQRTNLLGGALSAARTSGFTGGQYDELVGVSTKILSRGLDRKDELAADADGARFAARARYGAAGLVRFLGRLEGSSRGGLFPTHPAANDRIAALRASGADSGVDHALADRCRRFIALGN